MRFRILAFAITSSFAGLAGGFFGHYIGEPDAGYRLGGPDGAGGRDGGDRRRREPGRRRPSARSRCEFLIEALRAYEQWRLVVFGALLLLTIRFARNGLLALAWQQVTRLDVLHGAWRLRRMVRQR